MLTRSGLTYLEVSSEVFHDSFCQLGNSVSLSWVVCHEAFCLHVVSSSSCIPAVCLEPVLFLIPLQCVNLFCNMSKCILLFFSYISSLLLLFWNIRGLGEKEEELHKILNEIKYNKHVNYRKTVTFFVCLMQHRAMKTNRHISLNSTSKRLQSEVPS